MSKSVSKNLGYELVNNIAKTYRAKVGRFSGAINFRDKSDKALINTT